MSEFRCVEKINDDRFTWCGNVVIDCSYPTITTERAFLNKMFESACNICPTCITDMIEMLSN